MGTLDPSIEASLLKADDGTDSDGDGKSDLEEQIDLMIGGYVLTDLTGVAAVYPYNYGFVYELDEHGEVTKDSSGKSQILTTAAKSSTLVDGLYELAPAQDLPF